MKPILKSSIFFSALLIFPILVTAQVSRDKVEKSNDRSEILNTAKLLLRDESELNDFRESVQDFSEAVRNKEVDNIRESQIEILEAMEREYKQGQQKIAADRDEARRGNREISRSRKDIEQSKRDLRVENDNKEEEVRELSDDRSDLRDDIQDYEDERRDLASQGNRVMIQKDIMEKFRTYSYKTSRPSQFETQIEEKLLNRFIKTMEDDIVALKAELDEDKIELKEDRKELREDRRERRER